MTQNEVAKKIGVSQTRLSAYESGKVGMTLSALKQFNKLFGVSYDALARNDLGLVAKEMNSYPMPTYRCRTRLKKAKATQDAVGLQGEEYAQKIERERLRGTGLDYAVTSYADDATNGFDILSFDSSGKEIIMEVKSTLSSDPDEPFYMTRVELAFLRQCLKESIPYQLIRIYDLNGAPKILRYTAQDITIKEFEQKYGGVVNDK